MVGLLVDRPPFQGALMTAPVKQLLDSFYALPESDKHEAAVEILRRVGGEKADMSDAELVAMAGPGGSAVLDWRAGSEPDDEMAEDEGWRTWVDEVVVSWAACLLA